MSAAKRASPRLAEQRQKRLKLSLQDRRVPEALDIVFQHLTDPRLHYKLLQVCFLHFAPLLCKVHNITAGDKKFLQEWLEKPPNFWHFNPFTCYNLIEEDASFCLELALIANPQQFSKAFFPACLKTDSLNCLAFLLQHHELKLAYYDDWHRFPIRCLDYLLENDFADLSTNWEIYLKGFTIYLKRFWNSASAASFDANVARVMHDYQLILPDKLAFILVREIYHYDSCQCQLNLEDKLKWFNALLPLNKLDEFADAVVDQLSHSLWLLKYNLGCFSNLSPNFETLLLDKLRRHPDTRSYVLLCLDKKNDLPVTDADITMLIDHRPLLSITSLLKYRMTAAQKLHAVFLYLAQTTALTAKELDSVPLRKRLLKILVPSKVNRYYMAAPEAVSAHAWYVFQRLEQIGYPLEKFDTRPVRRFWTQAHNNCLWPWLSNRFAQAKEDLLLKRAAQSWLVNFCLEFPGFLVEPRQARKYRIIPSVALQSEDMNEPDQAFWGSRDMSMAQRVGHLFVWPLVDF